MVKLKYFKVTRRNSLDRSYSVFEELTDELEKDINRWCTGRNIDDDDIVSVSTSRTIERGDLYDHYSMSAILCYKGE